MRSLATIIRMITLCLMVTSCGITPTNQADMKAELEKVKGPEPGSIEASLKSQAEQAAKQGEFKRSSEMYKQLVDRVPNNADYLAALSETLRRANDCKGAMQTADQSLAIKSTTVVALETKGLCLMEKGEFADAGKALGEAIKLDDKRWRSLNGIGIIFAMKGRYDDSFAYYNAALALTPKNPSILNNKGLTLAMDKQFDEALKTFEEARDNSKNSNPAQTQQIDMNIALVYAIEGKLDEAEQTASPYLSKEALYNNMGFYAYLAKNSELAKSYLNMALTESPVYYERAWNNLGALNGDNSSQTPPSLEELKKAASDELKADQSVPPSKGAGIMLDEIPVSKPAGIQPGESH